MRFLYVYVLVGGPMNLSFMCLEQYIAVVHPTSYPLLKQYRCRELCSASGWLVTLPAATMKGLSDELRILRKSETIDAVAYGVLVLIVMVWSNLTILKALKKSGPATDK